jgi:tetratricopeptide (TPR) repeat protein/transcriptional regulator with XRE-family HTH domain
MASETLISPVRSTVDLAGELRRLLSAAETRTGRTITRASLARRIGVSQSSLYAYLNGTTLIPTDALSGFLRALEVSDLDIQRLRRARTGLTEPVAPVRPVLPVEVDTFTDRTQYLAELDRLRGRNRKGGGVGIAILSGIGGIGKTTLAVHWAHQRLSRFPDGCLYLDLRGFHPDTPLEPGDALAALLRRLGTPETSVPIGFEERRERYQQVLAGKRMLVLLDNAFSNDQVRPLLPPGTSNCFVLITSRDQLSGLVVSHGAHPLPVDAPHEPDARALLAARLGSARVDAEPDAVNKIVAACGRLPLALSIAAGRAQVTPGLSLTDLAAELGDVATALNALDGGDPATNVRTVLSWSLAGLTPSQARVFALLGVAPGSDLSLPAAASLAGLCTEKAKALLRQLERVSLVSQDTRGRYRMHDLVRSYAACVAANGLDRTTREAALRRVLDFYLHTAQAADRVLDPHRPTPELDPPVDGVHVEPPNDVPAAMIWFDSEHSNLLAAQRAAAAHDWHLLVWHLSRTLSTFQSRRGRHEESLAMRQIALDAANHLATPALRAHAHKLLGRVYGDLGRRDEASAHFYQALAIAEQDNDLTQQAIVHMALAWFWGRPEESQFLEQPVGDKERALDHAGQSLELFRAIGNPVGEGYALHHMSWLVADLGKPELAREHCEGALTLFRIHNDRTGEGNALVCMGHIDHQGGAHQQAIRHYEQALAMFGDIGNTAESAFTLDQLGHPHIALGQDEQARTVWRAAFEFYRQQGVIEAADSVRRRLDDLDRCARPSPVNA